MKNISFLMKYKDADIYIKRDDLLGFSFGGNKVRIVEKVILDMKKKGCDHLISYGSRTSNLNRAAAHLAEREGFSCTVIFKEDGREGMPFNEWFVKESGAESIYCGPDRVRETVEGALRKAEELGKKPYYIYGTPDGTGNEAVLTEAYTEAYDEILEFEVSEGISFDHIFLASGTGMTQSGLMAGAISHGHKREIVGISVARDEKKGTEAIKRALYARLHRETDLRIHFLDGYRSGGYGASDQEVRELCRHMLSGHGLPLDPVYTGKAFSGMLREIDRKKLSGPQLFIHTGGLPGVFDAACKDMLS
ncbi:MAG TPA: pyridoxal-phosphate dependent enzyme [Candidatus Avilachnospira avicola]|nr:pyridoxal-phosphate dependent enzyme [Candidatus Avilachnospira avicola]